MQQQNLKDLDYSKYKCEIHDWQILFLYFGEIPKLKSRLLCAKCVASVVNSEQIKPGLICLKDFLPNPGNQIMQITSVNGSMIRVNESQQIEEMEQLLQKFEDVVKQQIGQIRQNIIQLKTQFGQIAMEISQNLKLNEIVQQFQLLGQMDSYQGTNELAKLEEKLNHISENLNKIYIGAKEKAKDIQYSIFDKFNNKYHFIFISFNNIENEFDTLSKISLDMLQKMICVVPQIIREDIGQFPEIHQKISEGKKIQYQLLYQGTRDGLNAQSYWSKCNQQSNLLTIMTSKNGNRFGVYSPCLINSALNNWVQDPTMKSFLFQYNKKEIYKLTKQAHAVYCNAGYGPYYGGGNDVYVAADFNQGSSNLGHSYDISGYNIPDKRTHFFGDKTPQLQEIKVYKVIF